MENQQSSPLSLDNYRLNEFFERLSTETKCKPVAVTNDDPSLYQRPYIKFFSSDEEMEEAFRMIYLERRSVNILFDYSTVVQEVREANSYQISQKDCFFGKIKIATQIFSEGKLIASYALIDDEAIELSEEKFDAYTFKFYSLTNLLQRRYNDLLVSLDLKYSFRFESEKSETVKKYVEIELNKLQEFYKKEFPQEKLSEIRDFLSYTLSNLFEREGYPVDQEPRNTEKDGKYFYHVGANSSHDFYFGIDENGDFYRGSYHEEINEEGRKDVDDYILALKNSADFSEDELENKLYRIEFEKMKLIWSAEKITFDEVFKSYKGNRNR